MDKSNIAILTTVANFELYGITSKLFPKGIKKYVIDGTNGMHGIHSIYYMFNKLSNKGIHWLILADEDVIFEDSDVVFSIIKNMDDNNISVCGVRDGGVISHRNYNPIAVNTFFSILNFKEISKEWNKEEVKSNQFILPFEFEIDDSKLKSEFDINSLYEPYYSFFLWLKRKGKKFLYLDAHLLDDNISNTILFNGQQFACHTWYARGYNLNKKHTDRINNILYNSNIEVDSTIFDSNTIIFKDQLFYVKMKIKKVLNKIINRLKK